MEGRQSSAVSLLHRKVKKYFLPSPEILLLFQERERENELYCSPEQECPSSLLVLFVCMCQHPHLLQATSLYTAAPFSPDEISPDEYIIESPTSLLCFLSTMFPSFYCSRSMSKDNALLLTWKNWIVPWWMQKLQHCRGYLPFWHPVGPRQHGRGWAEVKGKKGGETWKVYATKTPVHIEDI